MQKLLAAVVVALLPMVGPAAAQQAMAPMASSHVLVPAAEMQWGDAPPIFEKGASFTVVSGNPGATGTFVVRLRMPAGYKIAPHWHPTDEHVTVISGTLAVGTGETFVEAGMKPLPAGGYVLFPAKMGHYVVATTAVTVQVQGSGPFALTYFNPADDPTRRAAGE